MTVAQPGSALTALLKAAALSLMQAEYCDTVAVQVAGMALQLAVAGPAVRQGVSWLLQFCWNLESEDALLEIPYDSPDHLHKVAWSMVFPK